MKAKFVLYRRGRRNFFALEDLKAVGAGVGGIPSVYVSEDSLIAGMTTDLSLTQQKPYRVSKTSAQATKICLVCGDRALGYNFNAISCESCKAFFRRNAFKTINGRCNGDCEVTVESRSYCKRCRLQKCFTVGMKRDLILNDQQKQFRSRKIRENRMKRTGSMGGLSPDMYDPSTTTLDAEPGDPSQPITHVIASDIDTRSIDHLDDISRTLLLEMMGAFQMTFDQPMERQPIDAPSSVEFLNMADTSVRRLVKMAKYLKFFKGLDQEDQISLLKGAVVEVLILRSSKMFNSRSLDWKVNKEGKQHTVSAMSFTQGSPESMAFIMQYQRFVRALLMSTHNDNVVLMILIVMTLFSPDRASRESVPIIAAAQETYGAILHKYLQLNYPDQHLMLPRLIQRLADIRDMNEKHTAMLMNMQIDKLEPLITEIFDLSC